MPFSTGRDGRRRAAVPLDFTRRVRRQPITPTLIPNEEAPLTDSELNRAAENRAMENSVFMFQSAAIQQLNAEEDEADALQGQQIIEEQINAEEEARVQAEQEDHRLELARSFAPERADIATVQTLMMNPKYQSLPDADVWEAARLQEGQRNATEFNRRVMNLPEGQRRALQPLVAGLERENMQPTRFQDILDAAQLDDGSVYDFTIEERKAANRIIGSVFMLSNQANIHKMVTEGASEDQIKQFMTQSLLDARRTATLIPTWSKDEGELRRWGDSRVKLMETQVANLKANEPALDDEAAWGMAFEMMSEKDSTFDGRFREYEKLSGVVDISPEEEEGGFLTSLSPITTAITDPGSIPGRLKTDLERTRESIAGIPDLGEGAFRVARGVTEGVSSPVTELAQFPAEALRETGELSIEVMREAVEGDIAGIGEEFQEFGGEVKREGEEAVAPIREPVEAAVELTREAIQGDLAGLVQELQEAREEVPQIGSLMEAWGGLNQMFEGEQKIVTSFTRPMLNETLVALGVDDGKANTISKYAAEILVPSTFIGGAGLLGKAKAGATLGMKMQRLAKIGLGEGMINMLQNRAGRKTRGEGEPSIAEDLMMVSLGFGAIVGLDMLGRALGSDTGVAVRRFLADEAGGATTGGIPIGPRAPAEAARIPGAQVVPGVERAAVRGAEAAAPRVGRLAFQARELGEGAQRQGRIIEDALDDAGNRIGEVEMRIDPGQPDRLEVVNFFVEEAQQGQGFGREMLDRAVEVARERGATRLTAEAISEGGEGGLRSLARDIPAEVRGREFEFDLTQPAAAPAAAVPGRLQRAGEFLAGERGAATVPGKRTRLPSRADFGGFAQTDDVGRMHGSYFITPEGRIVGEPGVNHLEVIATDPALRETVDATSLARVGEPLAATGDVSHAVDAGNTRVAVFEGNRGPEVGIEAPSEEALEAAVREVRVDLPQARISFDVIENRQVARSGVIAGGQRGAGRSRVAQVRGLFGSERGALTLPADLGRSKPRFNIGQDSYLPQFEDDVDRALFIVGGKGKSKRHDDFMDFLREAVPGATDEDIDEAAKLVRERIRSVADASEPGTIDIPETGVRELLDTPASPNQGRGTNPSPEAPAGDMSMQPTTARLDEEAVIPKEKFKKPEPSNRGKNRKGDGGDGRDSARILAGNDGGGSKVPPEQIPGRSEMDGAAIGDAAATNYRSTLALGESRGASYARRIDGLLRRVKVEPGARPEGQARLFAMSGDDLLARNGGDMAAFGVKAKGEMPPVWQNVVENPELFDVPKAVQPVIDEWNRVSRELTEMLVDRGIFSREVLNRPWARRIVVSIEEDTLRVGPRRGVGAGQGFEIPRTRAFVKQGDDVQYLGSMADTLDIYAKEVHHRVAGVDMARELGIDTKAWVAASNEIGGDPVEALRILQTREAIGVRTLKSPKETKAALNTATTAKKTANNKVVRLKSKIQEATRAKNRTKSGSTKAAMQRRIDSLQESFSQATARLSDASDAVKVAQRENKAARAKAVKPRPKERFIQEPIAGGKVFGKEAAQAVTERLKPQRGIMQSVAAISDPIRSIWANIDISFAALQMLAGAGRNPRGWAEAVGRAIGGAVLDPKYSAEFFVKKADIMDRMADAGYQFHRTPFALDPDVKPGITEFLFKRGPFKISMDMWNSAIDMNAIGLFEQAAKQADEYGIPMSTMSDGFREGFPNVIKAADATTKTPDEQILAAISHFQGQLTIREGAKLTQQQATALRAFPFAGRYWLGWAKAMASIHKANPEGVVARRMFGGWLTAGLGFYAAASYATGNEPTLNPFSKDFLTVTVGGQKVGIGGPLQQTLALMGRLARDPADAHNITTRWLRGKSAPLWTFLADMALQQTFVGDPVKIDRPDLLGPYLAGQMLPFTLQEVGFETARGLVERATPGEIASRVGEAAKGIPTSGAGLRGFPQSPFDKRNDKAQEMFGKDFGDLLPEQRKAVEDAIPGVVEDIELDALRKREAEDVQDTAFGLSDQFQKTNAAALAKAATQVTMGNLSHKDFREVVGDLDLKARGQREVVEALMLQADVGLNDDKPPYDDPKDADEQTHNDLWGYFQIFERYPDADVNPSQRQAMFDDIAEFRTNLGTDREDRMDRQIGISKKDVKLYGQLRADRAEITDAGFFDLSDDVWTSLVDSIKLDLPKTRGEYLDQLQEQTVATFGESFGRDLPPEALAAFHANDDLLKLHQGMLEATRTQFLMENPDIAKLALKWGYLPSSLTNLQIAGLGNQ